MHKFLLAIIAICIGLFFRKRKQHFMYFRNLNIPGPEPSIIFGNLVEIVRKNPVEAQKDWIRRYGRVVGFFYGYKPILLVADADLLKQIQVKDFTDFADRGNLFSDRPEPPPLNRRVTSVTGKDWKDLRSILTPNFTTLKLKQMSPLIGESISSLVNVVQQKAHASQEFNIYDNYQALTLEVICRTAFGLHKGFQENLQDPLLRTLRSIFKIEFSVFSIIIGCFPQLEIMKYYIRKFRNQSSTPVGDLLSSARDIIQLRRKDPSARRPDLLQSLLDSQHTSEDVKDIKEEHLTAGDEADLYAEEVSAKDNPSKSTVSATKKILDDVTINVNTFTILAAGYETTSNALASTTSLLVNYPDIQEKLRKEIDKVVEEEGKLDYTSVQKMKYLDCVISESLRLYSPIHGITTRIAAVDKQYGNVKIPKGLMVLIPVKAIHADPEYWPNPQEFNPDRFLPENKQNIHPMAFQAFGAGPRNCLGMRFAQMEMKLALAEILRRFRLQASDNTELDPPTVIVDPLLARLKGVHLRAVPI